MIYFKTVSRQVKIVVVIPFKSGLFFELTEADFDKIAAEAAVVIPFKSGLFFEYRTTDRPINLIPIRRNPF